eukprot:sb/3462252/
MPISQVSFSSRVNRTDIRYEHVLRSRRSMSMANEGNPTIQDDNRLKLRLEKIDREKERALKKPGLPVISEPRTKRETFTLDRLNYTLLKHGLPVLKKAHTAPTLSTVPDPGRSNSPIGSVRGLLEQRRGKRYPALVEKQSYGKFCASLVELRERNVLMKEHLVDSLVNGGRRVTNKEGEEKSVVFPNIVTEEEEGEEEEEDPSEDSDELSSTTTTLPPPPVRHPKTPLMTRLTALSSHLLSSSPLSPVTTLKYCEDIHLYLREHSRYNRSVAREEQAELHNWEAYRKCCPQRGAEFTSVVTGPGSVGSEGQGGGSSTSGEQQQHVQISRRNSRKVSQAATPELQQVVASDSSIKKVSDIVFKPKAKKMHGTMINVDQVPPAVTPRKPVRTVAQSSSGSSTSSTSSSPITQLKASSTRKVSITQLDRFEVVCGKSRSKGIFVSRIRDRSLSVGPNAISVGDEIVDANGIATSTLTQQEAMKAIRGCKPAQLAIRTNVSGYLAARDTFYVRALFNFEAVLETGLSFKFGQVLQVTDVESYDNGWWQACKIDSMTPRALGEVPSKDRADMFNWSRSEHGGGSSSEMLMSPKVPSYQRVRPLHLGFVRPVVLMGTMTHKFSKRLVKEQPGMFTYCLRFTTNQAAEGEFLRHSTKEEVMARCGEEGSLIDCQRKKNEFYYVTREEVQKVSDSGKHCVLEDANIYTVDQLQKSGVHPIVILVKCKSSHEIRSVRNCTSEQAVRTISKSNKLENEHLHKFTAIVSGNKCEDIFRSILSAISSHRESLWLPIS